MSNAESVLTELIEMSHKIGQPERDLIILGEGNTSAVCDDGTYWVKASGTHLGSLGRGDFVRMNLDPVCAMVEEETMSDDVFKQRISEAKFDPTFPKRPSTETVLHALALTVADAKFVAHTHPTAVNAIMCSVAAEEALKGRIFPDEIVVCGPEPAYVPYADPGFPLAKATLKAINEYVDEWGMAPKAIVIQNHGLIALGSSAIEADSITAMFVKTCRILAGTYVFGGPHFLSEGNRQRIFTRPDEAYRRKELKLDQAE